MRMCLVALIFFSGTVVAQYYEKTRFDRSIHDEYEASYAENHNSEKQWSYTDYVTQFVAYKSKENNDCYIENIKRNENISRKKYKKQQLYISTALTKLEAWRLAGGRIVDFCHGRSIMLMQPTKSYRPEQIFDPFFNEIPTDENDILSKRITDVVLTPLLSRTKRHVQLEQRKKLNENYNQIRQRRQMAQFRGKFRGQTQSQYLNIGSSEQKEGKAEAEATHQSSRAVVSGSRGMGQAQSMSSAGTGCEDCPGYPGYSGIDRDQIRVPGREVVPGGIPYPGATPGSGGTITYPGGVAPEGIGTYPGVIPGIKPETYPGSVQPEITPRGDGTYPGSVRPGIVRPGDGRTYPGGVQPGIISPGVIRPGTVTPGGDGTYPGSVHPGAVRPGGDGTYPGGIQPGIVSPGVVRPGIMIPRGDQTYPGGTYPGGTYPGAVKPGGNGMYPGGIQPGIVSPGTVRPGIAIPGGDGTYPPGTYITDGSRTNLGSIQPGIQPGIYYPGGVTTSVTTSATAGAYPGGVTPGTGLPTGTYPRGTASIGLNEAYPGTKIPSSVQPVAVPETPTGMYPGGIVPGVSQGVYPGGKQQVGVIYPGGVAPGTLPSGTVTYPAIPGSQIPGVVTTTGVVADTGAQVVTHPGSRPVDGQVIYPGSVIQPGKIPGEMIGVPGTQDTYPGAITYPGGIMPTTYPAVGQPQIVYPGGTQQVPGGTLYPNQVLYPGGQVATYPGGVYPSVSTPGGSVPDRVVPGEVQYPVGTVGDQSRITGIGKQGVAVGPMGVDDGAESQASSSVQQVDSGTQASASAQGKYGQGTAQSQVTGTYSGSGTFSAQAGTHDADKSAQTEISGGKEGATSNAEGIGGYGKSQTQVQLDSDSGATTTGAQSSGWNHGTNSQVQASSKGGMADAQANGEGSTSSQAQIGFQPYVKKDEEVEQHATPFRGSGTASAHSGTHRGQSQSQLQGSFQYGITYTGAAQAGSGSGAASSRKAFNFSVADTELFKSFKPQDLLRTINVDSAQQSLPVLNSDKENKQNREQGLQSSSTSKQIVVLDAKDNAEKNARDKKVSATEKTQTDDTQYDEYDDEYADDYDDTTTTSSVARAFTRQHSKAGKIAQQQTHQTQVTRMINGNSYDIHVRQSSNTPRTGDILQPGQSLLGYTVPPGFRGRVMSISGTETVVQGDGKSQSQTVFLVPKNSNNTKSSGTETRSLQTNYERHFNRRTSNSKNQSPFTGQNISSDEHMRPVPTSVAIKPSYYTVTNSVAGKMNGNVPRKYEHRYYTKSSTCGYFTFSCNVVYGSNGRTKICKPKIPTYPDGTPMRC